MHNLSTLIVPELLVLHAAVSDELRRRKVTRSANNPAGDLAEHLFCRALGWTMAPKSMRDTDAVDEAGRKYQIKARRLTEQNQSRQLGALRGLPDGNFDTLAAVLFDSDYCVLRAALIPHAVVLKLATRVERTNSWRFILRESVWSDAHVEDATENLRGAERDWAEAGLAAGMPLVMT